MISVEEAKSLIKTNIKSLSAFQIQLDNALGYTLAEDIYSPIDFPRFVQSSMDGYAFAFDPVQHDFEIVGVIQAGAQTNLQLEKGKAVRIFTGAPLPLGADTVLVQEKAKLEGNKLTITDEQLKIGANARSIGADIKKNALALEQGTLITPGAIGFLSSLGIEQVSVFKKPTIHLILTGNELVPVGAALNFGGIYESNSHTLKAALIKAGFNQIDLTIIGDTFEATSKALKYSLEQYDLTMFTGGISVGDFDFVLEACNANGVDPIFHKIKQKPGKPLYIGKKGAKVICGLPGNPASVLSCFYNYVSIVLDQLSNTKIAMRTTQAILLNHYQKPEGLTHFLKGLYDETKNEVQILEGQESFKMRSFAIANCFVEIPEATIIVETNQLVKVHLFS